MTLIPRLSASLTWAVRVAGCVAVGAAVAASAHAQAPSEISRDLLYVSTNRNLTELGTELTKLYLTLYNSGRLTVRADIAPGNSIEEVFRREGLYYGTGFPKELDSLACDLNTHVCRRARIPLLTASQTASLTDNVGGYVPSPGNWNIGSQRLVLPDIGLTPRRSWLSVQKSAAQPLEKLVRDELGGCERFDDKCKEEILLSNRRGDRQVLSPEYAGPITLPLLRVQAKLNIATAAEVQGAQGSDRPESPKDVGNNLKLAPITKEGDTHKILEPSVKAVPILQRNAPADDIGGVLRDINKNIVGGAKGAVQGQGTLALFPKDFAEYRKKLVGQISLKYSALTEYPAAAKGARVAVFDWWVDEEHCALEAQRYKIGNIAKKAIVGPRDNCDALTAAIPEKDHGTHIAGLIGAATKQAFGVNPYARVVTREIELSGFMIPAESLLTMADQISDLPVTERTDVVNMSFGYALSSPGTADPVEAAISAQAGNLLFVAAAGNYGTDKTNICDVRPACFNLPNVISVAALGAAGSNQPIDLLKDPKGYVTNYGTPIHVAAYGEDVFSTISGGRYGTMSGSSQAAALVSAVASMLIAKHSKLTPLEVKNRIIFCSDHVPELWRKIYGGRLNAECTLDAEVGRLRLIATPDDAPLRGHFHTDKPIKFKHAANGREVTLPMEIIRGIHKDKKTDTYIVYFNTDTRLSRETELKILPDSPDLTFEVSGTGDIVPIKASEIVGYASASLK